MNLAVMEAVASVDRGRFLPRGLEWLSADDMAVPIAPGVTVPSASYTAWVLDLLELQANDRVLEIGTGSGYQAVCLSKLCAEVITCDIDVVPVSVLAEMPENVSVYGDHDGRFGVYGQGEFDAILVTAACSDKDWDLAKSRWEELLVKGGRLVVPIGNEQCEIRKYVKQQRIMDFYLDDRGTYGFASVVPMRGRANVYQELPSD